MFPDSIDQFYFVLFSLLSAVFGLAAGVANVGMGISRIRRHMQARAALRFLNAATCFYMGALYSIDMLATLGPGRTISLYARPGVAMLLVLFFANVLANWDSQWTGR